MTDHAAPSAPLPAPSDDTAERLARLRLIRSPKVGPVTYRRLIAEYGSGADALAALPQIAAKAGVSGYAVYSKSAAQAEIRAAQSCAARALFLGEAAYLQPLPHCPMPRLFCGPLAILTCSPAPLLAWSARAMRQPLGCGRRALWHATWAKRGL